MSLKVGDTLEFGGTAKVRNADDSVTTDLTGWTGTAQLRMERTDDLIASFTVDWVDAAQSTFRLVSNETSQKAHVGIGVMDIRFVDPAGAVTHTNTLRIVIEDSVTDEP